MPCSSISTTRLPVGRVRPDGVALDELLDAEVGFGLRQPRGTPKQYVWKTVGGAAGAAARLAAGAWLPGACAEMITASAHTKRPATNPKRLI